MEMHHHDVGVWGSWQLAPEILLPIALITYLYWRLPSNSVSLRQRIFFYSGILSALTVIVTPIGARAMDYFSLHMVQHITLMMLTGPLLVLGTPNSFHPTAEQLWFILKYGFSQMIEKIKGAFDIIWGDLGKKIIDGLVNGINNGVDAVKGAVEGIANAAIETWKNITDTNSPSMVFDELGQFAGAGYIQGFSKSMSPQRLAPVMQNVMGGVAQTVSHVNHTSVTINNPAPEPASRSVDKTLKNLNYLRRAK